MAVTKEILSLAVETGDALLRNGAEVYRVEDTVMHILKAYEIEEYDVYVLSNGIFASANENKDDACSMIRHVPLGQTHLGRIAALNQLSREICSHECSLKDAWTRLDECKAIPTCSKWTEVFFLRSWKRQFFISVWRNSVRRRDCIYRRRNFKYGVKKVFTAENFKIHHQYFRQRTCDTRQSDHFFHWTAGFV